MAIDKITTPAIADDAVTNAKVSYNNNQFRNIIINGDMSLAQRGTSFTGIGDGDSQYTLDRFKWAEEGSTDTAAYTISQSTTVPTGQGFAKSFKVDCTTADTSIDANNIQYVGTAIEGQNLQYLKYATSSAENMVLSFWVRSNKTGTYGVALINNESTERLYSQTYTISSADTWEKKTLSYVGDTSNGFDNDNGSSLLIQWYLVAGSGKTSGSSQTWGSNTQANRAAGQTVNLADSTSNEWYITGVQLEIGTSASDFEFLPVDVNLGRCQRYYYLHASNSTSMDIGPGGYYTSSMIFVNVTFPCSMRVAPSVVYNNTSNNYKISRNGSTDLFTDFLGGGSASTNEINVYNNTQVSGTAGDAGYIRTNLATGSLAFNSEL